MAYLRNFGHNEPEDFEGAGINGKDSEFHSAMGLTNFPYIDKILESRKRQSLYYDDKLKGLNAQHIRINNESQFNYSYYPIIFDTEDNLVTTLQELNLNIVTPRRYFYPSLNTLRYLEAQETPISESINKRVLCLPLYFNLTNEEIDYVCRLLLRIQNN
jgi:dTDP-4-amino-4,6-dideoxygalactose transaminase